MLDVHPPHPGDLLLLSEAARLLGLSSAAVRQLCDSGRLPAVRSEKGVRIIRREDVLILRRLREQGK
jgi:excisionase family DNA binding protein